MFQLGVEPSWGLNLVLSGVEPDIKIQNGLGFDFITTVTGVCLICGILGK